MNNQNAIKLARTLGNGMAEQLNSCPNEAQNWGLMTRDDELPEGDWLMIREVAEDGEVTREMENAYKAAFNAKFVPVE